jgi:dihydroxy-acid dehydratase
MASAIEALGMSLPYSSSIPAEDPLKMDECFMAGKAIKHMLEIDLKPRDIMTRAAFENAMVIIIALGGSTNAVLHLIAMAHAVGITLTLDDFQAVSDRVPFIADLKPSGKYVMEDVHKIGGTPGVLKVRVAERLESVYLFASVRRPFFRFGLAPRSLRLLAPGKEKMKLLDSPSIASGRCR